MPILFNWIFKACLLRTAATIVALLAIFSIIEVFDKSRYLGHGMSTALLIEYLLLKMPFMITEFMPIILLIAVSIYISELSHHHELVAIRAAGLGIDKIISPVLCVGLVGATLSIMIGEWVTPITNSRLDIIERTVIHQKADSSQGTQWLKDDNRFYRITPLALNHFKVMILEADAKGAWVKRIDAAKASYHDQAWWLEDVHISSPDPQAGMQLIHKEHLTIHSQLSPDSADPPSPKHMTFIQLYHYVDSLKQAGLNTTSFIFELHKKLTLPVACLIMVLLAATLCINMGSRISATSWGLVGAITLGLLFYILNNASGLLVNSERLPAAYAAWLPILFFGGISGYILLHKEGK
ncbi:MAG: LptF/LptG family permease [Mariprofundaceae bacterium]